MWKLLFTFMLLMIATPSKAAEPTWEEMKKLELVFQSLNAIDAVQTIDCLNRQICYELNPLMGKHPSTEKVIGFKVANGIIHYILTKEIYKRNPKSARTFQYISIGIQGSVVAANMRFAF
jgi:hypothetical protein